MLTRGFVEVKDGVQCLLIKFFARKAAWSSVPGRPSDTGEDRRVNC